MKVQQQILANIISAVVMCGLAIFVFLQAASLGEGAALFPRLLSGVLAFFSILLIITSVWNYHKDKQRHSEEALPQKPETAENISGKSAERLKELYPFSITLLCMLFLFAYNRIGFELSAFGLMFATMLLIQYKFALHKFYYAIIIPVILILVFKVGVDLRLPLLIERLFQ